MKSRLSLLFIPLVFVACTKKNEDFAPTDLNGSVLMGTFSSGHGSFEGVKGQQFTTHFKDQNQFFTQDNNGVILNTGNYEYTRINDKKAQMFLTATSGTRLNEEIKLTLYFENTEGGSFEGSISHGTPGTQTGEFKLNYPSRETKE